MTMIKYKMEHYVAITEDGLYHVQNVVTGFGKGQHHVHTKEGFEKWRANIPDDVIHFEEKKTCSCGLVPSEVREYDGKKWKNERF